MSEFAFAKRPSEDPDRSEEVKEHFILAKNGNIEVANRTQLAELFTHKTSFLVEQIKDLNKRLEKAKGSKATKEKVGQFVAQEINEMISAKEGMLEPLYFVTALERVIELYKKDTWFGLGEKGFLELDTNEVETILASLESAFSYVKRHDKGKFLKTPGKFVADFFAKDYQLFAKPKEEMFASINSAIEDTPEGWFYEPTRKIEQNNIFIADAGLGDEQEKRV